MTIPNLTGATRYDTRGLPEGYDPHKFYEYRRDTLVKTATGIESFAYKYLPWSVIGSFAFALDPTYQFKVAPHAISPYNRARTKGVTSVLQQRLFDRHVSAWSEVQSSNYHGISVCWAPGLDTHYDYDFRSSDALTPQNTILDYSDDTTKRTRLFGSEQGTARFFKSYINSPPRQVYTHDTWTYRYHPAEGIPSPECSEVGGAGNTRAFSHEYKRYEIRPTAAILFKHLVDRVAEREFLFNEQKIAEHGLSMLKEWSPNKRDYTLFRNIVELKDIPRSILSLKETALALKYGFHALPRNRSIRNNIIALRPLAKQVPNEWLSYNFGWRQLYRDVNDLLNLPAKMSKKYDFLIRRAGKPTTFRVKRTYLTAQSDYTPEFDYDTAPGEYSREYSTRLDRTTELRLVVNATFDFPPPNGIKFRGDKFLDRIGAIPRPTDLYNLVPWTWLVDWFTGLGNYVEQIDNMHREKALINWGMITAQTEGKLTTVFKSKSDERATTTEDGVGTNEVITTKSWNHTSILNYKCQTRKDVAAILDVNTTSKPSLTAYQESIIGSILTQRGNVKRSGKRR